MNFKLSYWNFLSNVAFFLLGCWASSLLLVLDLCYDAGKQAGQILPALRPTVEILVVVMSAPGNRLHRDSLRTSWLSQSSHTTLHLFVIGELGLKRKELEEIRNEQESEKDLLLLPVVDSYRNLTLKVATCFHTVTQLYIYSYLLKVDDDSFIHISRLEHEVRRLGSPILYWGYFSPAAHVFKNGRWKETDWYLCDRYLPYAIGGGYVLGYSLAQYIADNYLHFKFYSSEDVSVGVWLSALTSQRIHDIRFDTQAKSRGCRNDQIVKHKVTPTDMVAYSERLRRGLNLCARETENNLKPYSYDWTKRPSECCSKLDPNDRWLPRVYKSHIDLSL